MDYKSKYKEYKKKYLLLKQKQEPKINSIEVSEVEKIKKENDPIMKDIFELIDTARLMDDEEKVFTGIVMVINELNKFMDFNNIKTAICIGDSPAIFFLILEDLWESKFINRNGKELKYLPLSGIKNKEDKLVKSKFKNLDKVIGTKILSDKIIFVDFLASGSSFLKFYNNLPTKIRDESFYFGYGNFLRRNDVNDLIDKLGKEKRMIYISFSTFDIFTQFIRNVTGNSERFNIRCIQKLDIEEKELILFDKIQKNKVKHNDFCEQTAKRIASILKNNWRLFKI